MSVEDRFKQIAVAEGLSRERFAMRAGIPYTRLVNIFSGRAKVRHEEIELIGRQWPEYRFWLAFGEELPESGQISPLSKQERTIIENHVEGLKDIRERGGELDPMELEALDELERREISVYEVPDRVSRKRYENTKHDFPPVSGESDSG